MRVINMAHGDFIMIGAYVAMCSVYLHLNLFWRPARRVLGSSAWLSSGVIRHSMASARDVARHVGVSIISGRIRLTFGPSCAT